MIYHCGAIVNWMMRYNDLRNANVFGTKTLLQLAAKRKIKPFIYISTISTADYFEGSLLSYENAFSMGHYGLSKWIAEQFVIKANRCGLPTIIYRPGMITGHSQTGASNKVDFTIRLISTFISLQNYFSTTNTMEFIPVNFVSKTILSLSKLSYLGKTFHITNPKSPTFFQLGHYLTSYGYTMECLPYTEWRQKLIQQSVQKSTALDPILSFFPEKKFDLYMRLYDRECLLLALKEEGLEDFPEVTEEIVHACLRYLVEMGVIPHPGRIQQHSENLLHY